MVELPQDGAFYYFLSVESDVVNGQLMGRQSYQFHLLVGSDHIFGEFPRYWNAPLPEGFYRHSIC